MKKRKTMMERRYEQVPSIMKRQAKMLKKATYTKQKGAAKNVLEPTVATGAGLICAGAGFMVAGVPGAVVGGVTCLTATEKTFKKLRKKKII